MQMRHATLSVRVNRGNPDHHLWNNHGTLRDEVLTSLEAAGVEIARAGRPLDVAQKE